MSSPNTLLNLTGATNGVASDETGINIKSFKCAIKPEFRKLVAGKYGPARGIVIAPMMLTVTITGEVLGSTGIMAAVTGTAYSASNSTAYFSAPTTGLYLVSAEVDNEREEGALRSMSAELEAYAGVA